MKHIGLVLSGGMGKGAYQIGALRAISEYFSPSDFEFVSAASVGALNTYAFLTENLKTAHDIWASVDFRGNQRFITSVLRSPSLQGLIARLVSDTPIQSSYYVPLLNLTKQELDYCKFSDIPSEKILPYLRASVALPFYNKGVKIGSKTLYDGAVIDNIPIYPLLKKNLDYILCIYFDDMNYVFENHALDNRILKLTFPDNKLVMNSVYITHDSIMRMIDEGYKRAKKLLEPIFADGTDNSEVIRSRIAARNALHSDLRLRLTGDVAVTNMNKVLKKLIRRKQILEDAKN